MPISETRDTTVTLTPLEDGTYRVSPFPFNGSPLELRLKGRYLTPLGEEEETTAADMIGRAPAAYQTIVLIAG